MRLANFISCMILIVSAFGVFSSASYSDDSGIALTGATLIIGDDSDAIADGVIIVRGGIIVCAGNQEECKPAHSDQQINLSGKYITPGLIDSHVHFTQTGWLDGRPDSGIGQGTLYDYPTLQQELADDTARWHRSWLCSGITSVYDVGGLEVTVGYQDSSNSSSDKVNVRAAGPLISHIGDDHGTRLALTTDTDTTFFKMGSDEEALASVHRLKALGSQTVKVWYLKPKPEAKDVLDKRLMLIGSEARKLGMDLIVHATELDGAKVALRAGAKLLVHSVEDERVDKEFIELLVEGEAFYNPTLVVGRNWSRAVSSAGFGLVVAPDDPHNCVDQTTLARLSDATKLSEGFPAEWKKPSSMFLRHEGDGEALSLLKANLADVFKAGAKIVVGTDSGNPLTMHGPSIYSEMELMQDAGMPASEVIRSATSLGAELLGANYNAGSIRVGLTADLIILSEDPSADVKAFRSITHVMRAGHLQKIDVFAREN